MYLWIFLNVHTPNFFQMQDSLASKYKPKGKFSCAN